MEKPRTFTRYVSHLDVDDQMTVDDLILRLTKLKEFAGVDEHMVILKDYYDNSLEVSARRFETQEEIDIRVEKMNISNAKKAELLKQKLEAKEKQEYARLEKKYGVKKNG